MDAVGNGFTVMERFEAADCPHKFPAVTDNVPLLAPVPKLMVLDGLMVVAVKLAPSPEYDQV